MPSGRGRARWPRTLTAVSQAGSPDPPARQRPGPPSGLRARSVVDYALAMRPFAGLKKMFKRKAPVQGTHTYMSPEQIRGLPPTPAADIYSFGITCYELACGRPPFRANSATELLNKHIKEKPIPLRPTTRRSPPSS